MSRPLRIAIVTPAVRRGDGQGRVNYEIAMRAANRGHAVTVLATAVGDDVRAHSNIRVRTWNFSRVPTSLLRTQLVAASIGRWLASHRHEFDIVHGNGSFVLAPTDVNTSHFVHHAWLRSAVHTSRVRSGPASLYYRALTQLHAKQEATAYARARTVVAVSERVAQELRTSGVDGAKIRVIHNGVDTEEFAPGPGLREALPVPRDAFVGLFVGDMTTPRKNLDGILRALVSLPNVHLAVAGSLRKNPYPAMAESLGIADRVHFLGFRRDIGRIMQSVDAFIFPSRYEACSLVMLEALAAGLPVITAITAGGAEIVAQAGGIVLHDPDQVGELSAAIARLAGDDQERRRLCDIARETALNYSWETMAAHYLELYDELPKAQ